MDMSDAHVNAYIHILEEELRTAHTQLNEIMRTEMSEIYGVHVDRVDYRSHRQVEYPCAQCGMKKHVKRYKCDVCGVTGVTCTYCTYEGWCKHSAICCGKKRTTCPDHSVRELPNEMVYTCEFCGHDIVCCCRPYTLTQQCTVCGEIKLICVSCVYVPTSVCESCSDASPSNVDE